MLCFVLINSGCCFKNPFMSLNLSTEVLPNSGSKPDFSLKVYQSLKVPEINLGVSP